MRTYIPAFVRRKGTDERLGTVATDRLIASFLHSLGCRGHWNLNNINYHSHYNCNSDRKMALHDSTKMDEFNSGLETPGRVADTASTNYSVPHVVYFERRFLPFGKHTSFHLLAVVLLFDNHLDLSSSFSDHSPTSAESSNECSEHDISAKQHKAAFYQHDKIQEIRFHYPPDVGFVLLVLSPACFEYCSPFIVENVTAIDYRLQDIVHVNFFIVCFQSLSLLLENPRNSQRSEAVGKQNALQRLRN